MHGEKNDRGGHKGPPPMGLGLSSVCVATIFVPKVESGERADVPKVVLCEQRVKFAFKIKGM